MQHMFTLLSHYLLGAGHEKWYFSSLSGAFWKKVRGIELRFLVLYYLCFVNWCENMHDQVDDYVWQLCLFLSYVFRERESIHLFAYIQSFIIFLFKLLVVWFLRDAWHCFSSHGPHFLLENCFLSRGSYSF